MILRPLGRSGLSTAPLAFGGNVLGWTADAPTGMAMLDAFADAGFNLIDTADTYSRWVDGHVGGESERIIGQWLKRSNRREQVLIATKVGMDMGDNKSGLSKRWIREALHGSLKRLGVEYIDLYQAHQDDPGTPLEETLATFAELISEGKVRAIGASNFSAHRLVEALNICNRSGLPRFETLQPHYNLMERPAYEGELQKLCLSENIGVVSYFGLARGFLTGKYRNITDLANSPRGSSVEEYLRDDKGRRVLAALDQVAQQKNSHPAAISLAWLIAQPTICAPIVSATSVAQWQQLTEAASLSLTPEQLAALNAASL